MNEELFKNSLSEENINETKTYDIARLFYVAFFGGIIPMVALGTINAKGLNVKKIYINLMLGIGTCLCIIKFIILNLMIHKHIYLDRRTFKYLFKILSLLLCGGYYKILKSKYQKHILTQGTTEPILGTAVCWICIGILVDLFMYVIGGSINIGG